MRFRLKTALIAAAVVAPLVVAAIVGPRFLDVDAYKPVLQEAVKQATGRELVIDGPLRLTLLPVPRVSARSVHFANAVGAKGAQMVDVQWVGASPSWWALLQGRVEIGTLILNRPIVVLETDADGVPNWEFKPGAAAQQPAGAPSEGLHLAVGKLDIVDGTLSYTNPQTGKTTKAEKVQATASVGSFDGPFSIAGTATVNGVPLSLDCEVGAPSDKGGHDTKFTLKVQSGALTFDGQASKIAPDATLNGHLRVTTGLLTDFIAAVVRAAGEPLPAFDASVVGSFSFDGGIEISPTRLALNDFKASLGNDSAAGTLALTQGQQPSLRGTLSLPKLDLEKWLTLLSQPGVFLPKTAPPAKPSTATASLSPFPVQLNVDLDLDIAEMAYRKGTVRDLSMALQIRNGVITVPRLKAVLPGDMLVMADAAVDAAGKASGSFSLAATKLRDTLAWLDVDASGVPRDRLQSLSVRGKLASTAGSVTVTEAALDLDGQPAKAAGSLTFGPPVMVSATLDIERFDLDAYMPTASAAEAAAAEAASAAAGVAPPSPPPSPAAPPDKSTPKFQLKSKVAKLIYRHETLSGVEANATVQGNVLTLGGIKVASLLGAKLDLKGSVTDFATRPRFDLTFNSTIPDTEKLLAYVQLPKFTNGKIGPSAASGGVAGTLDALILRDATVTMLGSTMHATGALKAGNPVSYDFPNFAIQTADAGRLIAVASGRSPAAGVGALAAKGALKGTDKRATFSGSLDALGARMQGTLDATLGPRPNITAKLRVPGTFDVDQWLGVSAHAPGAAPAAVAASLQARRPGAVTSKPIDLSGLQAFDATLSLETSATSIASLTVTNADLEATLRKGVLKISKFTGQFYGGAVDFTGTIDASGHAVVVDLTGSLQGAHFGEMLRGTTGTNSFGNPQLTVAVDGKLSALGIRLKGRGNTSEEIRNNLTGTAGLSGFVYPVVTQGSADFARFATGVGSLFSSHMAFDSAMLQGFVNRQNPIQGQISIGGGALTLHNPTVAGANTTATITSSTGLATGTTNTVVSINTGNDRTLSDFVINVKGPLAAPTVTTGRGPSN